MIFLRTCTVCGDCLVKGESDFCLHCRQRFPLWSASRDELRAHRFPRTAPVEAVIPWLAYSNSDPVCALIRKGKFNDRPELIEKLADLFAARLMEEKALEGIDAIVAVPMHWWKRMLRGYNQADLIAAGISRASGIPVAPALKAVRPHVVQSRKSGESRFKNVSGIFSYRPGSLAEPGMRLAVVDDILTTGATLSEAVAALAPASPSGITVLTLAATPVI